MLLAIISLSALLIAEIVVLIWLQWKWPSTNRSI